MAKVSMRDCEPGLDAIVNATVILDAMHRYLVKQTRTGENKY
jgi:hypothetical protein